MLNVGDITYIINKYNITYMFLSNAIRGVIYEEN